MRATAAFAGRKVHWTFRFTGSPLELVVEARDKEHAQEIRDRLAAQGFRNA
jgi:hypothetical protein